MPPLVLVVIAWVAGLLVAHQWLVPLNVEPLTLVLLSFLSGAAILLWWRDRSMRLWGACALALLLGALRYQAALPDRNDPGFVAFYNEQGWSTVEGRVGGYPDVRDTWTYLSLRADRIEAQGEWREVHGSVLVQAPRFPEHHYGDRLRVSGPLETPPEFVGFSYRDYLKRQGVYSIVDRPRIELIAADQGSPFWAALYAVKDRARDTIARLVPEPEASLLQGIVLGIERGIPPDLYEAYNTTGTSHIIAISGANITILAALFAAAFGRLLGKRRAYWFILAGIVLYVLLVGADSAVVRAGVMGGLYVTAIYLGRRATAYVSLFASALLLTAIQPLALWDAGFQLSFAATLGLILFTPGFERLFEAGLTRFISQARAREALRYLDDLIIVTLAAQILTLPLVAYQFGRLSLVAPLTNLLILPVQPLIMAWGGAATLVGLMSFLEPVARAIAWLPWLCLAYTNAVVRWMAGWPFASLQISQASTGRLVFTYGVILGVVWLLRQRRGMARRFWDWLTARRSTSVILGVPAVAAFLIWLAILQLPDGRLHVAFLDVGQGDAVLITGPQGQQILVDGGPSPTALASALGQQMPFWDRSIDLLVMTHPDGDHITGLISVLDRFQVGGWADNGRASSDALYAECQARLAKLGIAYRVVRRGERLDFGDGLWLDVMHPPPASTNPSAFDPNDDSVVLRLGWRQASFLLTGDVGAGAEQSLLHSGQGLESTVLKVAHHGSGGSTTAGFLAAVHPRYAVVSVGADNRFGHPSQEVLDRLAEQGGTTVLRTDQSGTVEFVTNGQQMWVRTER